LRAVPSRSAEKSDAPALDELRARTGAAVNELTARLVALEEHGRQSGGASAEGEYAARAELLAVARELTEVRSEVSLVEESHRRTAEAHAELDRHLADMAQQVASLPAQLEESHARLAAALDRSTEAGEERVQAVEGRVAAAVEASARVDALRGDVDELRVALATGGGWSEEELRQAAAREEHLLRLEERLVSRIQAVQTQMAAADGPLAEIDVLKAGVEELRTALAAGAERVSRDEDHRRQFEDGLSQNLERVLQQLQFTADADALHAVTQRLQTVESEVAATTQRPLERIDALEAGIEVLRTGLDAEADRVGRTEEDLRRSQAELGQRLESVLQQLMSSAGPGAVSTQALGEVALRLEEQLTQRLQALERQVLSRVEGATLRTETLQAGIEELRTDLEAETEQVRSGEEELRRSRDELNLRLEGVVAQLERTADADALSAVTLRLQAMEAEAAAAAPAEQVDALKAGIEELRTAVATGADRVRRDDEDLRRSQTELGQRLEGVVQQLRLSADAEARRATADARFLRLQEQISERLHALELQVASGVDDATSRTEALQSGIHELRTALDAEVERASRDEDVVRRSLSDLGHRLEGVIQQLGLTADAESVGAATGRLQAAETQVDALQAGVEELRTALAAEVDRSSGSNDDLRRLEDELRHVLENASDQARLVASAETARTHGEMQRVEDRTAQVEQMQAALAARIDETVANVAQVGLEGAARTRADVELLRVKDQLHQRLDSLAEWVTHATWTADERLETLALRVEGRLAQLDARQESEAAALESNLEQLRTAPGALENDDGHRAQSVEAMMQDLQARLVVEAERARTDFAELALANTAQRSNDQELAERLDRLEQVSAQMADPGRIERLERAAAAHDAEVAELYDFHGTLDSGMGQLFSELAKLRAVLSDPQRSIDGGREVKALQEKVMAQEGMIAALRTSIEALRSPVRKATKTAVTPAPAPDAKATTKAARPSLVAASKAMKKAAGPKN